MNPMDLPNLTEEIIHTWIKQHIEKNGKKPNRDSGLIEFASGSHKGITWSAVNTALQRGKRGLSDNSSLAKLIQMKFGIMNHMDLPLLTEQIIIEWVTRFIEKYGKKPSQNSGVIEAAVGSYESITWLGVNTALDKGGRGLPGGSSLAKFIEKHFGIRSRNNNMAER